jgi:hypothetical protein
VGISFIGGGNRNDERKPAAINEHQKNTLCFKQIPVFVRIISEIVVQFV